MKAVLLNDKQRDRIIKTVKPSASDYYSYQNLNLLTAVYDEEKDIYLTLSRYMSSAITRIGDNFDDYSFVLLTSTGCYTVSCQDRAGEYFGVFSPLPLIIPKGKIEDMIRFYDESFSERRVLGKEAEKDIDRGDKSYTEWYLEGYFSEKGQNNENNGKKADEKSGKFCLSAIICFAFAAASLIIGASYHDYRMHPENAANYNLGVSMGIIMIIAFGVFLLTGIVILVLGKRNNKGRK